MVRADSKPDSDRPHFYSQYWIDVAMGKPAASAVVAPAGADLEEEEDDDMAFAAPKVEPQPKASKPAEKKPDTGRQPLTSFADLANIEELMRSSAAMDDTVTPDITAGIGEHLPPSVPGLDYNVETDSAADEPETATASQDEDFFDYDEEEDEEDDDWGASRRNKKPGKNKRHEPRRDF